jgi:hypothetical protein
MKVKLKRTGITFVAVIAALSMSAAAAQAAEFHSEASHTIVNGTQIGEAVLTVNAGTVKCKQFTTSATQSSATVTTIANTGSFSECSAFGFINTTIDVNGCQLEANANTGEVNVVSCPTPLTITAFNCWITIGEQTGLKTVTYSNEGSGKTRSIRVKTNVSGIKYTQDSKSFPGCTNGTFTNGTFVGEGQAKGQNTTGEQVGIWKE